MSLADIQSMKALKMAKRNEKTINGFGYNLNAALFKWRTSLSESTSKIVTVSCIGDSLTEGFWGGSNYLNAWPVRLKSLLQSKYGGNDEGFVPSFDGDRFTRTGTWTLDSSMGMACGTYKSNTLGSTMTFTFTGTSVDIVYAKGSDSVSYGTATVTIDGVTQSPLDCTGTGAVQYGQKKSYTGLTNGSHTMVITVDTSKYIFVDGCMVYNGATTGIRVHRQGRSGKSASEFSSSAVLSAAVDGVRADLVFIALGTNDLGSGRTPAQLKTDLQTIINKCPPASVVLVPMTWGNYTADTRYTNWPQYVQIMYELADSNNIGLIDIFRAFGSTPTKNNWTAAQVLGLYGVSGGTGQAGTDVLHFSKKGQQYVADTVFNLIV